MGLEIRNVSKYFGDFAAVRNLNLQVKEGELFGLLGANGAGKTTTMRMILGLLRPTEGEILWNGQKMGYHMSRHIGYLPEERGLYPKVRVEEQLVYLAQLRGMSKADAKQAVVEWLERFRVPEYRHKKVQELSKGNQQKIQFISAVLHRPRLLILDEPFSGLDPVNVELLKSAVLELKNQGTTILFSSHRMEHVEEMCRALCILHRGEPVVEGELRQIKRSFGRKTIVLHTPGTVEGLDTLPGVTRVRQNAQGYEIQVEDEAVAQEVLKLAMQSGQITRFALEEPSLNEIFIEKVGTSYEEVVEKAEQERAATEVETRRRGGRR